MTHKAEKTKTGKAPLALLAAMAIASPLAMNIFAPVMPDVAEQLMASPFTIQLGFTLYLLTLAVGQLISGPIADQYGRRPVLVFGFLLHIFGCLIGAVAVEVWQLLLGRILQAAGGCTGMLLARSIIMDQYDKDQAAGMLGYITMGIATAQAIAPTVGGYLNLAAGWQSVFWLSMVLGSLVWLGGLIYMPADKPNNSKTKGFLSSFSRYSVVLSTPAYIWYALAGTMVACGFFIFITSAPFLVSEHMQGDSADYGNWFLMVAGGFWFGSLTAGKLSKRVGTFRMMQAGFIFAAIAALTMLALFWLHPISYVSLFVPMAIYTYGRGLSQPNAQAAAISSTTGAVATAAGMMAFFQMLIGSTIAQLTPLLMEISLITLPGVILTVALLAMIFAIKGRQAAGQDS